MAQQTLKRARGAKVRGPQCCPSGISVPLDRHHAEELARLLKAVADPARLQILSLLRAAPDGYACVCDLQESLALAQPTVSYHLKVLTDAGLINREQRGTWAWFSIADARMSELAAVFGA